MNGCQWNSNIIKCGSNIIKPTIKPTMKPSIKPTLKPSIKPTSKPSDDEIRKPTKIPTDDDKDTLCCNAQKNTNNKICKPIDGKNNCIINSKCYWDENDCLDKPCLGRRSKCKKNEDCCSNICVRFRGISHCS